MFGVNYNISRKLKCLINFFNTPLSSIDHPDRKSIKETDLKDTLDQMNLIDIYKAFHPKGTIIYIIFKCHETFSKLITC